MTQPILSVGMSQDRGKMCPTYSKANSLQEYLVSLIEIDAFRILGTSQSQSFIVFSIFPPFHHVKRYLLTTFEKPTHIRPQHANERFHAQALGLLHI